MRDVSLEDTFRHHFTTRQFSDGVPTVLAGTPVLSVLEENNATPITAGVSISVDRASVVGLNEATIIATAANGYEAGKTYAIYISTGTVGGVSVIGEVVGGFTIGNIADMVWDEVLTGATHNVSTSAGRRLRQLETGIVLDSGTLDAATSNTVDLETGVASTVDDFYNHNLLVITGLTGAGQVRVIVDYVGSGNVATVSPPWTTNPDATSTYDIVIGYAHAETTSKTAHVGLAQAGAAGTITLSTSASAITDFYKNDVVSIDSGTGEGQERIITAYNGSTKVATIEPNWTTNPDSTSNYIVEEALSVADVFAMHHSETAADNLKDDYDGTGFTRANSTIGTVTTNTDMRGTDSALLAASAPTNFGDLSITVTTGLVSLLVATQASIDAIETDTNSLNDGAISELAQGVPSATPTLQNAVMLLYMALRNKLDVQTSGTDALEMHNNAGTQIAIKLLTDDGSDYSEAKMTTGV